jgi:hypothetical protein
MVIIARMISEARLPADILQKLEAQLLVGMTGLWINRSVSRG